MLLRTTTVIALVAAVAAVSAAPFAASQSRKPLARARLALGTALGSFDAYDARVRRGLNACGFAADVDGCLNTALRPYEHFMGEMQRRVKALRQLEPNDRCRSSLDPLEVEVVRIGIAPRVAIFGATNQPSLARQAHDAWVAAFNYFTAARRRTRAACPGM